MMESALTPEAEGWAQAVAARLVMLQTSFADDPPDTRQGYLKDEVARSIKEVAESQRPEYLRALLKRFPGPETIIAAKSAPPPLPVIEKTPEELVDELILKASELPQEAKLLLSRKLQGAGFSLTNTKVFGLPPEARGKLGLTPEESLEAERLEKLFVAMLELTATFDQVIWSIWENLAPRSSIHRDAETKNLRRTIGRYLSGDREVATFQITQMLDKLRRLNIGLLSAIAPAGEIYARNHLETYAPEKIRAKVGAASGGFLSNLEQKCWRRYVELASELSGVTVEKQILDAVTSYTEELISGPTVKTN